jgi:hypothetical protein
MEKSMRQFTTCYDGLYAGRLQHALEAAGIEVRVTNESENSYLGRMQFSIWISDHADPAVVQRACSSVVAADTGDPAPPPTRVVLTDGLSRCSACGYDLRGQVENGNCPECGRAYVLASVRTCPACNADVPTDFDICWNCGRELPPPLPPPLPA